MYIPVYCLTIFFAHRWYNVHKQESYKLTSIKYISVLKLDLSWLWRTDNIIHFSLKYTKLKNKKNRIQQ